MSKSGRLLVLLVISVFVLAARAQQATDISIGQSFTMRSGVLNEERQYSVWLPPSYNDRTWGKHAYPVLYLLDGQKYFQTATGMIRLMSDPENLQVPEMIVV